MIWAQEVSGTCPSENEGVTGAAKGKPAQLEPSPCPAGDPASPSVVLPSMAGARERRAINRRRGDARRGRQGRGSEQRLKQRTLRGGELVVRSGRCRKCSRVLRSRRSSRIRALPSPLPSPDWQLVLGTPWDVSGRARFWVTFPLQTPVNREQCPCRGTGAVFQRFTPSPPCTLIKNPPAIKNPDQPKGVF